MSDEIVKGPTVVTSAFIKKDNKFLLVFDPLFKVWRVPGGRTEYYEKVEKTLVREMEEEIGLKLKVIKFLGYGQDNQYHARDKRDTSRLILFFFSEIKAEPVINKEEAEDFKWVTWEELKKHENKEGALEDFLKRNPGLVL